MLSVGEVMAIGRSFEESIQKAVRMVSPGLDGLHGGAAFLNEHRTLDEQLKVMNSKSRVVS